MPTVCFLIDDDEDDREIFAIALESAGSDYQCIAVGNGREAIEKLSGAGFIPDYIFIDLNMPYMSGSECLESIRRLPHLAGIPVVVYTTSSHHKDLEETRSLGASHYLVKPPSISSLTEALKGILTGQQLPFLLSDTP